MVLCRLAVFRRDVCVLSTVVELPDCLSFGGAVQILFGYNESTLLDYLEVSFVAPFVEIGIMPQPPQYPIHGSGSVE